MTVIHSKSASQTKKLGEFLAKEIGQEEKKKNAFIIALQGNLGAGKTTFTQGFAEGLGIREHVVSPTFVLLKIYKLPPTTYKLKPFRYLIHIDCYRIKRPKDLVQLGTQKIFNDTDAIVLLEWPERVKKILPKDTLFIRFEHAKNSNQRIIRFQS